MRSRRPLAICTLALLALAAAAAAPTAANPLYAAIVVDGNTGKVIRASDADATRYPASLTKIMTLYIVFEEMTAGRLAKSTPIKMSARAAGQPPSKLGLKAGGTLTADQAIRALVTKSANDVANALAEHIAGTESAFAQRMTKTARRLGMSKTTFRNASGLPDAQQKTTARDLMVLARRIQSDFPDQYAYFKTRSFSWSGRTYSNHNKLLGRYAGVDGIKTGYIRASGFNLVTNARRGDKHVIAVVMGGKTARRRDAHMRELLDAAFPLASAQPVAAVPLARAAPPPRQKPEPVVVAQATPDPAPAAARRAPPAPPWRVVLAMVPTPPRDRELPLAETVERPVGAPTVIALGADDAPTDAGPDLGRALGIFPAARRGAATPTADDARQIAAGGPSGVAAFAGAPAPRRPDIADLIATAVSPRPTEHTAVRGRLIRPAAARDDGPPPVTAAAAPAPRAQEPAAKEVEQVASSWRPEPEEIEIPSGWHVQVGAYANASQAEDRLDTAKQAAKGLLAEATAFAMPVAKEQGTIYRARFAGLNKDAATRACTTLKRAKIDCIVVSQ